METDYVLLYSQEPTTDHYPNLSSAIPPTIPIWNQFLITFVILNQ
jgi:hypothetical protein